MTSFRLRDSLLFAFAAIVIITGQAPSPQPSATPVVCARPNVPAQTIRAVEAETPAVAQVRNISGTVEVIVSLNADSTIAGARIRSSPSALLDEAALSAARQSKFQAEIRNCRPVAGDYIYTLDFEPPPAPTLLNGKPAVVITAVATVSPAPDSALVSVAVHGAPASDPSGARPPVAIVAALRAKLASAGIRASEIAESSGSPTYLPAPPFADATSAPVPAYGESPASRASPAGRATAYTVFTNLRITVSAMRDLPAVLAAVRETPGWFGGSVQYVLRDREPAYREALARAVRDAQDRADVAARAAGMRLGTLARLAVEPPDAATPRTLGLSVTSIPLAALTPPSIAIRARVTATYLIER